MTSIEHVAPVAKRDEHHVDRLEKGRTVHTLEDNYLDDRYETTQRGLKNRHVQLMALGGTIGTGLFVGSGQSLHTGGPASLLISYIAISILVFSIATAIAEVGAYLPVHGGSMASHGHRYVSRSLGFSMGWLYWYSLGILVPYETVAASLVIGYWNSTINVAIWITIMTVVIVGLNFLPVRFYGESEFWFAGIKIITLIGLLIVSFILFWGGGPNRQRLGFHYWKDPGSFNTYLVDGDVGRFVGLLKCIVSSAIAFIFAPELIIVSSGEMESPRRNVPRAARRYIYRLVFFYILAALAIGVICPSNASQLTTGSGSVKSSPFVVGIQNAGIPVLDHIINAAVLTSAWSAGNSFLYMSSRSLYSLAVSGNAPSIFKTCNRWGVPYYAVGVSALFSLLAYLSVGSGSSVVFNWLINFTNTSGFISWICCCIVFFRFRKAIAVQGIEQPYKSSIQPYGAYFGLAGATLMLLINGFTVFFPSQWSVSNFFTAYIGIPAFLVLYLGHRLVYWNDRWAWRSEDVDMQTGLQEVIDAEQPEGPKRSRFKIW
ncbi:Amino acid/polyamine transporter I family protein [Penicillium ucsense]|uniref:Amino acid/polyamine transporter I family protein n=1 Tax=Penicillium ucsense TaxID=2839758 RepID=A0A8J8WFE0_9EURO|nr:Amino acid/polyamine transporter I family protein [Penicillium ucsense]KAF7733491.1 Amino acid/polyamine transporter I family protein [Penicillium ucsense]